MKQEYRYLRRDILKRRVKEMRNMPVKNVARRLGRTVQYTERLITAAEVMT